jgi:hypothetical protein
MISNWAYILIGDNDTGKTTFQKHLLEILCGQSYDRLPRNIVGPSRNRVGTFNADEPHQALETNPFPA